MGAGGGDRKKKRQCRIHSYACVHVLITSHTAILKREVINGCAPKVQEELEGFIIFLKVNI